MYLLAAAAAAATQPALDRGTLKQAEGCADALDASFSDTRPFDDAMKDTQTRRDDRALNGGIYEFTCQFASMQSPPDMQQWLEAV